MAKNKGGRPTKLTPELVTKLEEVFALDGTVEEACFYAGISRNAYYEWIKEHPELNDKFMALRERPVLKARQTVVNSLETSPDMALKYLERKKKDEFSVRHNLAIGGDKDTLGELTDFFRAVANTQKPNDQGGSTSV